MKKHKPTKPIDYALYYLFDKEADILYLSQGKPSSRDRVVETGNDLLMRISPTDGSVRGVTILNASKRASKITAPVKLPIRAYWSPLSPLPSFIHPNL